MERRKQWECGGLIRTDQHPTLTCLASVPPCVAGHSVPWKTVIHQHSWPLFEGHFPKVARLTSQRLSRISLEVTGGQRPDSCLELTLLSKSGVTWVGSKALKPWFLHLYFGPLMQEMGA